MRARTATRWAAAAVVALLLALLHPSPAATVPTWLPPMTIADSLDVDEVTDQVAVADAVGNVTVVWTASAGGQSQVRAAAHRPGRAWTVPVTVSDPAGDATLPALDTDASGKVTAVWLQADGGTYSVQSATLKPGGWWRGRTRVGPAASTSVPRVAVSDDGHAVATWSRPVGGVTGVQVSLRGPTGAWSRPRTVSTPGQEAQHPDVDMHGRTSTATVVWDRPGTDAVIQTAQGSPEGAWSPTLEMSVRGQHAIAPHVVVAPTGQTTIVWIEQDGSNTRVEAISNSRDGLWIGPYPLSPAGVDATNPDLAVDPRSRVTVVWRQSTVGPTVVASTSRRAEGSWTDVVTVSDPSHLADEATVAADPTGGAVASWYVVDGGWQVQAARLEGRWGPPRLLDVEISPYAAPAIAVDGSGDALVAWAGTTDTPYRISARALDVAGPRTSATGVPKRTTVGHTTSFAASAVDTWSHVASYRWRFGDGKKATGRDVAHVYRDVGTYRVTLITTDAVGNTARRRWSVSVLRR